MVGPLGLEPRINSLKGCGDNHFTMNPWYYFLISFSTSGEQGTLE